MLDHLLLYLHPKSKGKYIKNSLTSGMLYLSGLELLNKHVGSN